MTRDEWAYTYFEGRLFALRDGQAGWDAGVQAERERIKAIIHKITDGYGNCEKLHDRLIGMIDE